MADRQPTVLSNPDTDFDREEWSLALIAVLAIVIVAFLVAVPLILHAAYPDAVHDADRKQTVRPPAPMLQTDPAADLRDFRAEEDARLRSYGWVDRAHGIVHIPIDEAMKRVARTGIPDFPKAAR